MDSIFAFLLSSPWLIATTLIVGFVLLIYGADWLVDGASAIAKRLGVSDLIIGLTVVAFGTSMPEFIVSIISAANGSTELAITNVLGSNSINTFVVLGFTALIYPIVSERSCRQFDIPCSLAGGLLVLFFATYTRPMQLCANDLGHFDFTGQGFISAIGGYSLLLIFVLFLVRNIRNAMSSNPQQILSEPSFSSSTSAATTTSAASFTNSSSTSLAAGISKDTLLIIIGLAGLVVGGEFIVRSATTIALNMGVSDAIIGLTVVALGTSLPELATSCIAAFKKNADLAIGNVIGSNIFNIFFILGTSAAIRPLPTYDGLWLDALMVCVSSLLVMLFCMGKRHRINRLEGALLLFIYAAYLTYRLMTL